MNRQGIDRRRDVTTLTRRVRRIHWLPYSYVMPALVFMGLILFYPIVLSIVMSFQASNLLHPTEMGRFVGLSNYQAMIDSSSFWQQLRVTFVFTFWSVLAALAIGLAIALLLNRKFFGRSIARALVIVPWAVPPIVATIIWILLFNPNFGSVDYLLGAMHLTHKPLVWLTDPVYAMFAVIIVTIWQAFPVSTVMFLAGLQGIPAELYEAAAIDGAGRWARFRHVTWPGLASVTGVLVLLQTIWIFRSFVTIYVMTGGGPAEATNTLVVSVYLQAFQFFNFGYATAIGTVTLVLSLGFAVIYLASMRKFDWGVV